MVTHWKSVVIKAWLLLQLFCKVNPLLFPTCNNIPRTPLCTRDKSLVTPELPICCVGIDEFVEGRSVDGNAERPNNEFLPTWLNLPLVRRGQEVYNEYWYPLVLSMFYGLVMQMNTPDIREVLMFTGVTLNRTTNLKRDVATFAQALVWAGDIWYMSPSSVPNSNFMHSMAEVRNRHKNVELAAKHFHSTNGYLNDPSKLTATKKDEDIWADVRADLNASSIPPRQRVVPPSQWGNTSAVIFNQQAMAFVMYHLASYPTLFTRELGITACDNDVWALNHLFAVVSYALGIEDKYNPTLQPDLESVRKFYRQLFDTYVIPGLFNFEKSTFVAMENVLEVAGIITKNLLTSRLLLYRYLKYFVKIEPLKLYNSMTAEEKGTEAYLNSTLSLKLMQNTLYRGTLNDVALTMIYGIGQSQFPGQFSDYYSLARYCYA